MAVISPENKKKLWRYGEVLAVAVVIIMVWGLYSIPTIVKYKPEETDSNSEDEDDSGLCIQQAYDGICKKHLLSYQSCVSNSTSVNETAAEVVYIPARTAKLEETASIVLPSLVFLNPSAECEAELAPFVCFNLFGICGDQGEVLRPSSSQCHRVTSDVCATEWMTALELFTVFEDQVSSLDADAAFPNCLTLPNKTTCDIKSTNVTTTQLNATGSTSTNSSMTDRVCSTDFYKDNFNVCLPLCGEWEQYSHTTTVAIKVITTLSISVFLVATSLVLVLSFIQHKRMLKLPSVFLIYQLVSGSTIILVWLIGYTDRKTLHCSHRDYGQSVLNPTNFCYFSGIVQFFTPLHTTFLWLCHIFVVLWGILFPFRARATLYNLKYSRCLHIILLLMCFLLPAVITVGTFGVADYVTRFTPELCTSRNPSATFYFLILPLTILSAAGVTPLILILALIFRRRRTKQRSYVEAELKILVSFFYYIILTLVAIGGVSLVLRHADEFEEEILKYFLCESMGNSGENTCSRSGFESIDYSSITVPCIAIVLALYPLVILTYVINIKDLRQYFSALAQKYSLAMAKMKTKSSGSSTNSHMTSQGHSVASSDNASSNECETTPNENHIIFNNGHERTLGNSVASV